MFGNKTIFMDIWNMQRVKEFRYLPSVEEEVSDVHMLRSEKVLEVCILILHVDSEASVAVGAMAAWTRGGLVVSLRTDVGEDCMLDRNVCVREGIGRDSREISANVRGVAAKRLEQIEAIDIVVVRERCVGDALIWGEKAWVWRRLLCLC